MVKKTVILLLVIILLPVQALRLFRASENNVSFPWEIPDIPGHASFRACIDAQKLPPRFSNVSIPTTQSGDTCCITKYICSMGMATQPPV